MGLGMGSHEASHRTGIVLCSFGQINVASVS